MGKEFVSVELRPSKSEVFDQEKFEINAGGDFVSAAKTRISNGETFSINYPMVYDDSDYNKSLGMQTTYLSTEGTANTPENPYITQEKNRILAQKHSIAYNRTDGAFGIGTVYLNIPPTQISISNEAHNFRYSSLRSPGEVVVSSGRTTTRIDLQIMFNGFEDINSNLRSLLAQFKTTPFLPLENDYIRTVLNPFDKKLIDTNYLESKKAQLQEMEKREKLVNSLLKNSSDIDSLNLKTRDKLRKLSSKGYLNKDAYDVLMVYMDDLNKIPREYRQPEDTQGNNFNLEHYIRRNMTVPLTGNFDMMTVERDLTEIGAIRDEIYAMEKKAETYNLISLDDKFKDRQIVGVLSQMALSTVPGFPETISCNLSMYVFNYDPFSIDFSFIAKYNPDTPTPDITKCELFIEWYTKRWLIPREDVNKMSLGMYTGSDSMEFTYITHMDPVNSNNILNKVNIQKKTFNIDGDLIITGITASIRNQIQFLPILSSKSPTCQYMGSLNSDVQITMECSDILKVKELCKMLDTIGVISRTKNRLTRNSFVYVSNEFLGLMAMPYFCINDYSVDTVPGNPDHSTIVLNLIEYKPGQEKFQTLKHEGATSQEEIVIAAEWILDKAREYIVNGKSQYKKEYLAVTHERYGWFNKKTSIVESLIYGIGGGSSENEELRQAIFSRCGNISTVAGLFNGKRVSKFVDDAFLTPMTNVPIAATLKPLLDTDRASISIEAKYGLLSKERYLYTKDYIGYAKRFFGSISSSDDSFFNDNKNIVARVASVVKRSDVVRWILFSNKNPELNEYLNNRKNRSGNSLRNKEDIDAGKISAYPDLDLPRYKDIPDGYRFMNTLKKVGSPLAGDIDKSAQSITVEADPDFFMWRGSIWDAVDQNPLTGNAVQAGLNKFKALALTNSLYRRQEPVDEDVLSEFLSSRQRDRLEEKYMPSQGAVNPGQREALENGIAYVAQKTADNGDVVPNVHDGDTLTILASNGKEYSVRLNHYDAGEIANSGRKKVTDKKSAEAARDFLSQIVEGETLIIEVSGEDADQYGRPIVDIWTTKDGKNKDVWINGVMLDNSKELNIQYYPTPYSPYDLAAERKFLESRENFINPIRKAEGKYKFKPVYSGKQKFLNIFDKTMVMTSPLYAAARLGGFLFFTPPNEAEGRSMDFIGYLTKSIVKSLPGPVANMMFPENWITNDLDAVVAKAVTTKTNNRGLYRFDREADEHIEIISKKIRESQKDDTLRMSRAFPTFKVYFIEEDMPEWGRMDDEYSYQGVSSIDITKSRQEAADVAVITFMNTKGTLDRSLFGLYSPDGRYIQRENQEYYDPSKQETRLEQNLDEFVLKVGTVIKVKMGYSSDPELLETVFTGMVAEVNGGDVVTVVAQGFGVELLHKSPKASFYTEAASAFKVLDRLITSPEVVHFGKWQWFPKTSDTSKVLFRRYQIDEKTGKRKAPAWWRRIGGIDFLLGLADDTRNNNIWVPENSWAYNITHGGYQTFVTQDKTIWEVFREMSRRYPGYITTVLPFDNRATIYFGPSDFMYWYTDKNQEEVRRWEDNWYADMSLPEEAKLNQLVNELNYQEADDNSIQASLNSAANRLTDLYNNTYKNNQGLKNRVLELVDCINNKYDTQKTDWLMAWNPGAMGFKLGYNWFMKNRATAFCEVLAKSDLGNSTRDNEDEHTFNYLSKILNNPSDKKVSARLAGNKFELKYSGDGTMNYKSPQGEILDKSQALRRWADIKKQSWSELNPSRKLVRQYHFKDSFHHVVSNNIVATSQYMYNKVTIEYGLEIAWKARQLWESAPGFSRVSAQIDDDIWIEKVKEKLVQERNARDVITAWNYALGNLWEETRKMYSGHLVMLGDPTIKPYDIIMLSDYFTDMFGPIEVEQVTHHFSADTGFVTTIVPNLMCYVNNTMQQGSVTVAGAYSNAVCDQVQKIRGFASIAGPFTGEILSKVAFWMTGLSTGRREPISFSPLIYAGRPFIAGVEGLRRNGLIEAAYGRMTAFMIQNNRLINTAKAVYDTAWLRINDNQMFGS
jgi:endonuclease YncB( thermonuclease family)